MRVRRQRLKFYSDVGDSVQKFFSEVGDKKPKMANISCLGPFIQQLYSSSYNKEITKALQARLYAQKYR